MKRDASISTRHFIRNIDVCTRQRDPTNASYTHIQVDICLMQHVPVVTHKGIRYNGIGSENYVGDLLNLVIAKLTDNLVGLLIERDAMARTIVEIHGTTL